MKVTLYYDFDNERYYDFPDSISITSFGYEYTTNVDPSKSLEDIYKECRQLALKEAAFKYALELGGFINAAEK